MDQTERNGCMQAFEFSMTLFQAKWHSILGDEGRNREVPKLDKIDNMATYWLTGLLSSCVYDGTSKVIKDYMLKYGTIQITC